MSAVESHKIINKLTILIKIYEFNSAYLKNLLSSVAPEIVSTAAIKNNLHLINTQFIFNFQIIIDFIFNLLFYISKS